MTSDLTYYVAIHLLALGVIVICGAGISYGYVSEGRWGERRGERAHSRPQKAEGVLVDRATQERDETGRDVMRAGRHSSHFA